MRVVPEHDLIWVDQWPVAVKLDTVSRYPVRLERAGPDWIEIYILHD